VEIAVVTSAQVGKEVGKVGPGETATSLLLRGSNHRLTEVARDVKTGETIASEAVAARHVTAPLGTAPLVIAIAIAAAAVEIVYWTNSEPRAGKGAHGRWRHWQVRWWRSA
jgi:hypothetical protein